jgi:hypothetical protein
MTDLAVEKLPAREKLLLRRTRHRGIADRSSLATTLAASSSRGGEYHRTTYSVSPYERRRRMPPCSTFPPCRHGRPGKESKTVSIAELPNSPATIAGQEGITASLLRTYGQLLQPLIREVTDKNLLADSDHRSTSGRKISIDRL